MWRTLRSKNKVKLLDEPAENDPKEYNTKPPMKLCMLLLATGCSKYPTDGCYQFGVLTTGTDSHSKLPSLSSNEPQDRNSLEVCLDTGETPKKEILNDKLVATVKGKDSVPVCEPSLANHMSNVFSNAFEELCGV
ncbi:hypothetical protein PIB30_024427 [Stylosanthes scabra]|uniref:Uncharacterized protein n=1 Tax=Stylosanthes scabra TaxID=79078 RepID=A0ABU6V7X1_9FABA|nr:hypothetical protein [Stylosanthes scabra]